MYDAFPEKVVGELAGGGERVVLDALPGRELDDEGGPIGLGRVRLAERPDRGAHVLAADPDPAVAARVGEVAGHEEPHRARRQAGCRRVSPDDLDDQSAREQALRALEHALAEERAQCVVVEDARRPGPGGGLHGGVRAGISRVAAGEVLVGEGRGDAVPADRDGAAAALRVLERHARGQLGDDAVGKGARDDGGVVLGDRRALPLADLALGTLHEPSVREGREHVGGEREEVVPHGGTIARNRAGTARSRHLWAFAHPGSAARGPCLVPWLQGTFWGRGWTTRS